MKQPKMLQVEDVEGTREFICVAFDKQLQRSSRLRGETEKLEVQQTRSLTLLCPALLVVQVRLPSQSPRFLLVCTIRFCTVFIARAAPLDPCFWRPKDSSLELSSHSPSVLEGTQSPYLH